MTRAPPFSRGPPLPPPPGFGESPTLGDDGVGDAVAGHSASSVSVGRANAKIIEGTVGTFGEGVCLPIARGGARRR